LNMGMAMSIKNAPVFVLITTIMSGLFATIRLLLKI
jgi:hypothetical protein